MDGDEVIQNYKFLKPTTQVKSADMIQTWENSESYQEYLGFILAIGDSVRGKKLRDTVEISSECQK